MVVTPEIEQKLTSEGWDVECHSPLEIRHHDGSFASLHAAQIVIDEVCNHPTEDNTIQFVDEIHDLEKERDAALKLALKAQVELDGKIEELEKEVARLNLLT